MAALIFVDFDASHVAAQGTGPTSWDDCCKPPGVFIGTGVVAQSQATNPNGGSYFNAGRTANSTAYGHHTTSAISSFNIGTTQVAIKRTTHGIGSECWSSCDLACSVIGASTTATVSGYNAVWRWGDLQIIIKSATLVTSTYTIVFSVKNNGSEVATITVPNIVSSSWMFMKVAAKLHSSTGYITATIDGVAMSASVTGVNTVTTLAEAGTGTQTSADHITFGVPVITNGSNGYIGKIDNIYIDDASHPTGRPRGERISLGSSSTDVNASAVGTGATTIANALDSPTDAKAARFTGAAASSIIDLASYSTSGIETNLIGFNFYLKRAANRDANVSRFISVGVDISGVQTMGTLAAATTLAISSVTTPPNTDYLAQGVFDKMYTASVTTSNLANVKVRLLTS